MACSQLPLTWELVHLQEIGLVETAQRGCSHFQNHSVLYSINILPTKALPGTWIPNQKSKQQPNITEYSSRARPTLSYVILTKALQGKITLFQGRNRLRGLRKERPLNSFSSLYQPAASSHHSIKMNPHVGCEETLPLPTGRWLQLAEAAAEEQGQGIQTQHKEATGLIQRLDSSHPCSSGQSASRFSSLTSQHRQGLQPRPMASPP